MTNIKKLLDDLGAPYDIQKIDGEECIHRILDTGYEFEVSGTRKSSCTLYVWKVEPRTIVAIYQNIPVKSLKDILGYYATKYQNLTAQIQVEREDETI